MWRWCLVTQSRQGRNERGSKIFVLFAKDRPACERQYFALINNEQTSVRNLDPTRPSDATSSSPAVSFWTWAEQAIRTGAAIAIIATIHLKASSM